MKKEALELEIYDILMHSADQLETEVYTGVNEADAYADAVTDSLDRMKKERLRQILSELLIKHPPIVEDNGEEVRE
jgi:hypothetical protein